MGIQDIDALVANMAAVAQFMVAGYTLDNPPFLIHLLVSVTAKLHRDDIRRWYEVKGADLYSVPTNVLAFMQMMLQSMVEQARSLDNQNAVKAGTLSDPLIFQGAADLLDQLNRQLTNAAMQMSRGDFSVDVPFADLIRTRKPRNNAAQKPTETKKRQPENKAAEAPAAKQQKQVSNADKGLLCFSGSGDAPLPDFMWAHRRSNGTPVPFCRKFLFRGDGCGRKECPNFHLTRSLLQNMSTDKKKQVIEYVKNTPNVEFAPGQEITVG